jgi:hypothetical protein
MFLAQPGQFTRTADALQRGVDPQGHEQAWVGGVAADVPFHRFDLVEPTIQAQTRDRRPDHTRSMVGFEQFIERRPVHLDLIAVRNAQPGPARHRPGNFGRRWMIGRPFIKQQWSHHRPHGTRWRRMIVCPLR